MIDSIRFDTPGPNPPRGTVPESIIAYYREARGDLATAREIVRRGGTQTIREIQERTLELDFIDTTAMIDSWTAQLADVSGQGLAWDLVIRNPVDYADIAHIKGRKGQPFADHQLPPVLDDAQRRISTQVAEFTLDRLGDELAERIVGAFVAGAF